MRSYRPFRYDEQGACCAPPASVGGNFAYRTDPSGSLAGFPEGARETLYLGNLDLIIDRLQELFDYWSDHDTFPAPVTTDMLCRARLAVHEWVANLVQHADFQERVPEIALSLWVYGDQLCGIIADNSKGFEMDLCPSVSLEEVCDALPERGMGLLLLQACADAVYYYPVADQGHRLEFTIS